MCAAPIAERPAFTRSVDANSVLCAGCSARGNLAPMCLFPSIWLPLSVTGYQRMVARAGEAAGFAFQISSHVLRHSCGYKLANDGRDTRSIQHYLGHRSIVSTVRTLRSRPIGSRISGRIDDEGPGGAAGQIRWPQKPTSPAFKTEGVGRRFGSHRRTTMMDSDAIPIPDEATILNFRASRAQRLSQHLAGPDRSNEATRSGNHEMILLAAFRSSGVRRSTSVSEELAFLPAAKTSISRRARLQERMTSCISCSAIAGQLPHLPEHRSLTVLLKGYGRGRSRARTPPR